MTESDNESGADPNKAPPHGLVKYDTMCRAIGEAHAVDEVKDIRDKAIALEAYMRQIGNTEAEDRCYQIRMRAQRKAGELSKHITKAAGRPRENSPPSAENSSKAKVLEKAGISTQQASEWERLADVPEEQFEAAFGLRQCLMRFIISHRVRQPGSLQSGAAIRGRKLQLFWSRGLILPRKISNRLKANFPTIRTCANYFGQPAASLSEFLSKLAPRRLTPPSRD
jgi:hypothetical protein